MVRYCYQIEKHFVDRYQNKALHHAVLARNIEAVKYLAPLEWNLENVAGNTPLKLAIMTRFDPAIVELLQYDKSEEGRKMMEISGCLAELREMKFDNLGEFEMMMK